MWALVSRWVTMLSLDSKIVCGITGIYNSAVDFFLIFLFVGISAVSDDFH